MKNPSTLITVGFSLAFLGIAIIPRGADKLHAAPSGWVDIMPDSSFEQWTRVTIPPDRPLQKESQWSVNSANHTLVCTGNGGHEWLRYERELGNFLFHVEWRLRKQPGATDYNSGVFVRNDSRGIIWYQAQIGDASGGYWFGQNPAGKALERFTLHSKLTTKAVRPAGEWNTFDIRCQGKKIILKVNGTKTSEFDECEKPQGYLGLEAEGSRIEFRHLRIKALH